MDYQEIRDLIANARKRTPVTCYVRHDGELSVDDVDDLQVFPTGAGTTILIGEWDSVRTVLDASRDHILYHHLENDRRNSAIPMLDLTRVNARIEPGAAIREKVDIGDHVLVMMGAVIHIGAVIGPGPMIALDAVFGARASVGPGRPLDPGADRA